VSQLAHGLALLLQTLSQIVNLSHQRPHERCLFELPDKQSVTNLPGRLVDVIELPGARLQVRLNVVEVRFSDGCDLARVHALSAELPRIHGSSMERKKHVVMWNAQLS